MKSEIVDAARYVAHAGEPDLALAGEIASVLAPGGSPIDLPDRLDAVVERVRARTRADAAEIFLADPGRREAFMVSHGGADIEAFCHRERFASGEGFPGIVLASGASLRTRSLPAEAEFLRTRVKSLRYRSAICVPIREGDGVCGCFFLAWKACRRDLRAVTRLVALIARPVGAALELARALVRMGELERAARGPGDGGGIEERIGALVPPGAAARVLSADPAPEWGGRPCPPPGNRAIVRVSRERFERCPARRAGCVQVLGGRHGWPHACLDSGCVARARYCVPLVAGADGVLGVATVGFGKRAPTPLTRHVAPILWWAHALPPALPVAEEGGGGDPAPPLSPFPLATERRRARAAPEPNGRSGAGRSTAPRGARLRIRCFGGMDVKVEGRTLDGAAFGRAKARELLGLLVARGGRPTRLEELAEGLWPGAEAALARNRFHVTLSALRAAVEPPAGDAWLHVLRDGSRYYLDPASPMVVDVWRFDALLKEAEASATRGELGASAAGLLEAAIALYEGHAFAGAFEDSWSEPVRHRSREAVLEAIDRLATLKSREGDLSGAISALRRAEEIDPLREDLGRRLMEVLDAADRRREAVACFRRLEQALGRELGLSPSPETRRLHTRIVSLR